tara:strand:- start:9638 stop:10627 length:990 start_codon:yes stop_codon:yes gene_type:complete
MIKKLLIYNSGGGIGDSLQILPLLITLKKELKNTKFYYLSAHQNHFNTTLKDFKFQIDTLDLEMKYFGFRWRHLLFVNKKIKKNNIDHFDLIIDLQSKLRNTLILKMIPHKAFISTSFNFMLSKPNIKINKSKKINNVIINAVNLLLQSNYSINEFDINIIDKKFFIESERLLPKNNYVGFSITQGNVYRKKQWSYENIVKISQELIKKNKIPVFFIEKKYFELKNKIKNDIPTSVFPEHETNLNSPALVTCLGKRLNFAITIDNGIMHMLSLSKVPIISLFGPTDSEKFAPQNKNSIILDSKKLYNSKNVSDITVEDVLKASEQFLSF